MSLSELDDPMLDHRKAILSWRSFRRRQYSNGYKSKQEAQAQLMLKSQCNGLRGQTRSPNIVPFDMLGIVSIVTLSLNRTIFEIFNFENCRDLEIRVKGHSMTSEPTRIDPPPMTSYFRSIITMGLTPIPR